MMKNWNSCETLEPQDLKRLTSQLRDNSYIEFPSRASNYELSRTP